MKYIIHIIKINYRKTIEYLRKHKLLALFLSHGGLHLIVLLLCIVGAFIMYNEVQSYNSKTLRQFSFKIEGDSLNNYDLSHLTFFISRGASNSDSIKTNSELLWSFLIYNKKKEKKDTSLVAIAEYEGHPNEQYNLDAITKVSFTAEKNIWNNETLIDQKNVHSEGNYEFCSFLHRHIDTVSENSVLYTSHFEIGRPKQDMYVFAIPNMSKDWDSKNAYLHCFYGIHAPKGTYNLDESSKISIQYNKYPYDENSHNHSHKGTNGIFPYPPIVIDNILPKPTEINLEEITYIGKDIEKVFKQGGIYFTATDQLKKAKANKMEFLWTVLIGTIVAFSLDIIIQLVIKWRKL